MDCRELRQLVMTTRAAELTAADLERLAGHELHCEGCAKFHASSTMTLSSRARSESALIRARRTIFFGVRCLYERGFGP